MPEPIPQGEELTGSITKHLDKRFFGSIDLVGHKELVVTIKRVELHPKIKFENGKTEKNIKMIYFEETEKPLVIRDVHIKQLVHALGSGTVGKWKGRKIAMYALKGTWFGVEQYAVRFRLQEVTDEEPESTEGNLPLE